MVYAQQARSTDHAKNLRKRGGRYLRHLRNQKEMTQKELADAIGLEYYTFISQIETGAGRVPPDLYQKYAEALDVPIDEFAKKMLMFYDPFTYKCIFGLPTKKDLEY